MVAQKGQLGYRTGAAVVVALVAGLWLLCCGPVFAQPTRQSNGRWSDFWIDRLRWRAQRLAAASQPSAGQYQRALVLLNAALRLKPGGASAARVHKDRYELLLRLGQVQAAMEALDRYVGLESNDTVAGQRVLAWRLDQADDIDQQMAMLQGLIASGDQPAEILSEAHRRLGELYYQRFDLASAIENLHKAVQLAPLNLSAGQLLLAVQQQRLKDDQAAVLAFLADRTSFLLRAISANPADVDACWQLAALLDDLSLHAEAQQWYRHAMAMYRRFDPAGQEPRQLLLDYAGSLLDGASLNQARKILDEMIRLPTTVPADVDLHSWQVQAHLMLYLVAKKQQDSAALKTQQQVFDRYYDWIEQNQESLAGHGDSLAMMAMFYSVYGPSTATNRRRGLELARLAAQVDPDSVQTRLAKGLALLAIGRPDEAVALLEPLAKSRQLAAVGLALGYIAQGKSERAEQVLVEAGRLKTTGLAYEQLVSVLADLGKSPPPPADCGQIRRMLETFNRRVLEFFEQPQQFIDLQVHVRSDLDGFEPIVAECVLKDTADFPITIGPAMMIGPAVVLQIKAQVGGDEKTFWKVVQLDQRQVLEPGQLIRVDFFLDLAARNDAGKTVLLADWLQANRGRHVQLSLTVIVNAVTGKGSYKAGAGGFSSAVKTLQRPAVSLTEEQIDRFLGDLNNPDPLTVAKNAFQLLEAQMAGSSNDRRIEQAIINLLSHEDWRVRVTAASAARYLKGGVELFNALAPKLKDRHWLVRLAAGDTLGQLQGEIAAPILKFLAGEDTEPLVRRLAAGYLLDFSDR